MTTFAAEQIVTDEQRRKLDEDGYFITDVLFDEAELEPVRREFKRIWEHTIAEAEKHGDALTIEQARNRAFIARLDRQSPACDALCRHPALLAICREVLGPDIDLTWNQAIIKPPREKGDTDNAFAWHQDMWYATRGDYANDTDPAILLPNDTGLTAWIAISRTTVDNGTLWVLPGKHKEGLFHHVWDEGKREWCGQFDTSWRVPAVMRAGQAVMFRKYLPHWSGSNVSNEVRMAYQLGFAWPGLKKVPSLDVAPVMRGGEPAR